MAATLYLMRHGIAEDGLACGDAARRLTDEGRHRVAEVAGGLARMGVLPDLILASPLVRAQETAAIVTAVLAPEREFETYEPLANDQEAAAMVAQLEPYRRFRTILLVGHQPSMGEFASQLLTGSPYAVSLPFKKGAVAAIAVGAVPPRAPGQLLWFAPPRLFRSLD